MIVQADDGCPLHVEIEGPAEAPVLMLCNSLGTDLQLWDDQMPVWSRHFRVVRYDRRGHGRSGVTPGPYTMQQFGRDALSIMDALGLARVHWCGLSMGGMVGQWLGAHAPERIDRLILANTTSYYDNKKSWDERIATVRAGGLAPVADALMKLWFTSEFRTREPETIARMTEMVIATPLQGYLACCEAVRDMDHRDILADIRAPTLVIAGRYDNGTPLPAAEFIRSRIPGAALTLLDAAHISNVEQPALFTTDVLGFLTERKL
jgi:3-oxoadipate enol-lactonase